MKKIVILKGGEEVKLELIAPEESGGGGKLAAIISSKNFVRLLTTDYK